MNINVGGTTGTPVGKFQFKENTFSNTDPVDTTKMTLIKPNEIELTNTDPDDGH